MRKLILAACGSLILAAPLAHADFAGIGASVGYWDSDLSGDAARKGDSVDVDKDLGLKSSDNVNLSAYLEHPIPLLPNVRLSYISISQDGNGQIPASGYDFLPPGPVYSKLDVKQLDLTLYYQLLDNWVNLDLGLTIRDLSGDLSMTSRVSGKKDKTDVDVVLPMGYVAAQFDLPLTGLSAGVEGNAIAYSGDSVYDVNVYGQYRFSVLSLRAGYRQMSIDYEDGNDKLDIEIGGPFISAGLLF